MGLQPLSVASRLELERATAQYESDYSDDEVAHRYLEKERGLSFPTIGRFRLGVVRRPVHPAHQRFRGMLCIPNISAADDQHVVGLKFRSVAFATDPVFATRQRAKYDQPDGQVARLFNLAALNYAGDTVWVTEGEVDALSLEDVGLPAIAVPGAAHWGRSHAYRSRILEGLKVILMRDSDAAGLALAKAMADLDDITVRDCLPAKDCNDMLLTQGPGALHARAIGLDAA